MTIEVFISDGNRKINWLHHEYNSIENVLKKHGFKPVEDSVMVESFGKFIPVKSSELGATRLFQCPYCYMGAYKRVSIQLKSQPLKPVKKPAVNMVPADVR